MYTQEELKEAGLDDFRVFLANVFDFLGLPEPTDVQLNIAWHLQHGPKRLVIMAFRGVGKSWITTIYSVWRLLINSDFKVEVVSAGGKLSDDISKFALTLIKEMPILEPLRPKQDQRKSLQSFDVAPARPAKSPSMKSAGITGQITGTRADLIIADDVEIPKNSYTHHLREKLRELTKEFSAILKPEEQARIVYLGTPQVEDSLYPILEGRGYKLMIWPAEVPEDPAIYNGNLAPYVQRMYDEGVEAGTPTDPKRFPRKVLDDKKAEYGKSGYALQFMLDTNPSAADKHPLKLSDLVIHDVDNEVAPVKMAWGKATDLVIENLPAGGFSGDRYHSPAWISDEMAKYGTTVMAIDPAGRGKDELAAAIIKELHSTLYLMWIGGFRDGYAEETLKALAIKGARYNVGKVITETNFGGGMFNELLKPYLAEYKGGRIDEDYNGWSTGMKETRILRTLEPVVQQHRLVVDRRVIEDDNKIQKKEQAYSFVYQFTRMENVKGALAHEDRLESVAMAAGYFELRMSQDRDRAIARRQQEALDNEIRDFLEHSLDMRPGRDNYVNLT